MKIEFIDLQRQYQLYKEEIDKSIMEVLSSSRYILGKQVEELENKLAQYCNTKYALSCASGSDAILISLMALDLKAGDEIITTPFTFIATAEMPALLGIKPVFVDIDEQTYNIDIKKIEKAITKKTKAIIPVDIFGQICEMDEILEIAKKYDLYVIEDAAQSFGALYKNKKSCSFGDFSITSFFPAKPLGCYGEGGMIFTNNKDNYEKAKSIRNHGQVERYEHKYIGINGRLDTLQAAILLVKFKYFDKEIELREKVSNYYNENLKEKVITPYIKPYNKSVYAQYSIRSQNREKIINALKSNEIPFAIHYPSPLHLQPCFSYLGYKKGDFPVSEKISNEILSLPMHPYITDEEQDFIIKTILSIFN